MATIIPIEHPSLILGGIVPANVLKPVANIVSNQSRIDGAFLPPHRRSDRLQHTAVRPGVDTVRD